MKKLLFVFVLLFAISSFTSCTPESVDELETLSPNHDKARPNPPPQELGD